MTRYRVHFFSIDPILTYEEFADLKVAEEGEELRVQETEMVEILDNTMLETQDNVAPKEVTPEIPESIPDKEEPVVEVIDYTKLSLEERASHLPVPTDDYTAEYDAYCQRMGYTAEKMKSIRYKMTVYDEFREEYDYRKQYHQVEEVRTLDTSRGRGAR